ncbi:MAG: thermonuclease family protein [Sandaracinaceae bacterium]|nr:thermonuclease family protein [Sandaracinaceae bacterium]
MRWMMSFALALSLAGCPRHVGGGDAGTDAGDGPRDGGGYDPVLGNAFDGPLLLDDERLARIDPSGLRAGPSPCRAPIRGRLYRVIDGDTFLFTAADGSIDARVRMIGVDTPELAHDGMPAQCYGTEAAAFTSGLLDRQVWLTFDADCTDSFGRMLAYVHVGAGSGDFFQRQLLRRGFARVLTIGGNRQYRALFEEDESAAMGAGAGLWSACF